MKRATQILPLLALILAACGSALAEAPVSVQSSGLPALVSPDQLASSLPDPGLTIVDVRTTAELQDTGIIEGAIHIPLDQLEANLDLLPATDAPILIYCRSGNRSNTAQNLLQAAGYSAVSDLDGGIRGWTGAGYALVPTSNFFTP